MTDQERDALVAQLEEAKAQIQKFEAPYDELQRKWADSDARHSARNARLVEALRSAREWLYFMDPDHSDVCHRGSTQHDPMDCEDVREFWAFFNGLDALLAEPAEGKGERG
jgi:hypothetical protein